MYLRLNNAPIHPQDHFVALLSLQFARSLRPSRYKHQCLVLTRDVRTHATEAPAGIRGRLSSINKQINGEMGWNGGRVLVCTGREFGDMFIWDLIKDTIHFLSRGRRDDGHVAGADEPLVVGQGGRSNISGAGVHLHHGGDTEIGAVGEVVDSGFGVVGVYHNCIRVRSGRHAVGFGNGFVTGSGYGAIAVGDGCRAWKRRDRDLGISWRRRNLDAGLCKCRRSVPALNIALRSSSSWNIGPEPLEWWFQVLSGEIRNLRLSGFLLSPLFSESQVVSHSVFDSAWWWLLGCFNDSIWLGRAQLLLALLAVFILLPILLTSRRISLIILIVLHRILIVFVFLSDLLDIRSRRGHGLTWCRRSRRGCQVEDDAHGHS